VFAILWDVVQELKGKGRAGAHSAQERKLRTTKITILWDRLLHLVACAVCAVHQQGLSRSLSVQSQQVEDVDMQDSITATALFTNVRAEAGGPHQEPEIYPRALPRFCSDGLFWPAYSLLSSVPLVPAAWLYVSFCVFPTELRSKGRTRAQIATRPSVLCLHQCLTCSRTCT
jgi:hypothetical protein